MVRENVRWWPLFSVSLIGLIATARAQECQECMKNGFYCKDETTYYYCPDGESPMLAKELKCTDPAVCTNTPFSSATKSPCLGGTLPAGVTSVCKGGVSSSDPCGSCDSGSTFVCISRSQYKICGENNVYSCNSGYLCSMDMFSNQNKLCASKSVLDYFEFKECSGEEQPAPTPNPSTLLDMCAKKESESQGAGYYYIANCNDATCKSYIYCQKRGPQAVIFNCKDNQFYDPKQKICVNTKPSGCFTPC